MPRRVTDTGRSRKKPPPPMGRLTPTIRTVPIGNSMSEAAPSRWISYGNRGAPGCPYRSCRIGYRLESYRKPSSSRIGYAQAWARPMEKFGARYPTTACPRASSIRALARRVSARNSAGVWTFTLSCRSLWQPISCPCAAILRTIAGCSAATSPTTKNVPRAPWSARRPSRRSTLRLDAALVVPRGLRLRWRGGRWRRGSTPRRRR